MKTCRTCLIGKNIEDYAIDSHSKTGRNSMCKKCMCERTKIWQRNNPDKVKKYNKETWVRKNKFQRQDKWLQYKFGISAEEYNKKLQEQNGVCAICGKSETVKNRSLAQDHNHKTGQLRGLLCWKHNTALGKLDESPEILQNMIDYLNKWNNVPV